MKENIDSALEKVEPNRREFIKKVAVGAAYAVPVMASFSLDSVRNKAFAQATYTTPAPAPGQMLTPPKVVQLTAPANGFQVNVKFNQPMNTNIAPNADSRPGNIMGCYDREVCFLSSNYDSGNAVESSCDDSWPHSWAWDGNQNQILSISGGYCGFVQIRYGKRPDSDGCIDFKSVNGLALQPFDGQIEINCPD